MGGGAEKSGSYYLDLVKQNFALFNVISGK